MYDNRKTGNKSLISPYQKKINKHYINLFSYISFDSSLYFLNNKSSAKTAFERDIVWPAD